MTQKIHNYVNVRWGHNIEIIKIDPASKTIYGFLFGSEVKQGDLILYGDDGLTTYLVESIERKHTYPPDMFQVTLTFHKGIRL